MPAAQLTDADYAELGRSIGRAASRAWRRCSYRCDSSELEALEQSGWESALSDATRFDPTRGTTVAAYAAPGVAIKMRAHLQSIGSPVSAPRAHKKHLHGHVICEVTDDLLTTSPGDVDFSGWQAALAGRVRELAAADMRVAIGLEALARGERPRETVSRLGVPYQVVKNWRDRARRQLRDDMDLRDLWSELLPLDESTGPRVVAVIRAAIGLESTHG